MPSENDRRRDDYEDDDRPRRRRDDEDDDRPRRDDRDDYDDRPRRRDDGAPRREAAGSGLATAGLVLGILGIFTLCLTGIPAIICSAIALGRPAGRGKATAGLILGLLTTAAGIGLGVWGYIAGTHKVRLAAARMADQNNMKQIGIAFHNQGDWNGMAGPYALDRMGKPNTGLSWRVGLLPYIEQDTLYKQFDLTVPWDGAKNKRLSANIIKVYSTPFNEAPSADTPYRVFYGGGAMFNEDGKPVSIVNITDGTSNTIMAVHAWEQVPWAAPREFKYDPNGPLPKLGHPEMRGGANVLVADGSIRFLRDGTSERTLRALITRGGGETVASEDW
jgi:hypothetical protein